MAEVQAQPAADDFSPTKALGRAILVAGLLLLVAALTGRFDLVVLAAPFALGTALSLVGRARRGPVLDLSTVEPFALEGAPVAAALTVGNPDAVRYDVALVRLRVPTWIDLRHGDRPYAAGVGGQSAADIDLTGRALRWGRHPLGPAVVYAITADGLYISKPAGVHQLPLRVYPLTEHFDAAEAMPRAAGLVGQHRSRRPGEGGELAGVRMFGPGDRLRRIDWRTSLRTRQLHVVATLSDRDAEVMLLLDVLHEAGRSGGVDGAASVLDTTVRAAAGVAEHYLHRGDRVSLIEYGLPVRRLRAGSGRRHYLATLEWLLDVSHAGSFAGPSTALFGPHMVPSHALVVVMTPLLDVRSVAMLAALARAGRFVVAVDTLVDPTATPPNLTTQWAPVAHRLWLLERENLIGQLRAHGVPVVAWAGAGSLDAVLASAARMPLAPSVRGVR